MERMGGKIGCKDIEHRIVGGEIERGEIERLNTDVHGI